MKNDILCQLSDIAENTSKGFCLSNGSTIFIVKKEGQLFIYENSCPHLGVELEWLEDKFLDSENNFIQCSTHGALFNIQNGDCISGPCMGKALKNIPFTLDEKFNVVISRNI